VWRLFEFFKEADRKIGEDFKVERDEYTKKFFHRVRFFSGQLLEQRWMQKHTFSRVLFDRPTSIGTIIGNATMDITSWV
jgi:hypothetical protein